MFRREVYLDRGSSVGLLEKKKKAEDGMEGTHSPLPYIFIYIFHSSLHTDTEMQYKKFRIRRESFYVREDTKTNLF